MKESKRKPQEPGAGGRQPYDPRVLEMVCPDSVLQKERGKFSLDELKVLAADKNSDFNRRVNARSRAHDYRKSETQAALLQSRFGETSMPDMDINWLRSELEESNARIAKGDLTEVEAMLFSHASALSSMFTTLAQKAQANMGQYISAADTYFRLALKAQSQCRTTLEALAEIKNPRAVAFVKQANIANGPQQVNNSTAPDGVAREPDENPQSKVLEHVHGERLDFGATGTTGRAHQDLETVGAINRPQDGRGEGSRVTELLPGRRAA